MGGIRAATVAMGEVGAATVVAAGGEAATVAASPLPAATTVAVGAGSDVTCKSLNYQTIIVTKIIVRKYKLVSKTYPANSMISKH